MVFLGSHPNLHSHKSPKGTAKLTPTPPHHTHTSSHTPMVRKGEVHLSLPLQACFWPRAVSVNSRGKTVTDFQGCSRSKSRRQVEAELAWGGRSHTQSLTYTLTYLGDFGGHKRASSITCGWPRFHIKANVKFKQPLWD